MKSAFGVSVDTAASGGGDTTHHRRTEFTRGELKDRGWTVSMITKLMPIPDRVQIGTLRLIIAQIPRMVRRPEAECFVRIA